MLELANLGWCKGTSDDMSAARSGHSREINTTCRLHYAHEGLLIEVCTIGPTVFNNDPTQFLNRRLCPAVYLRLLSKSNDETKAGLRE